jgi:hypothetical protein
MKKLIVMVAALCMVATSAYAADWDFFGSARVMTWVEDLDIANTDNLNMDLQGNARIGAKVKVSDELTGGFEYGTGVNVRKLYGEWNFGGGTFLVGQTYTPLNMFYSNQVYGADTDLLAYGGVYSGRHAMLRLKFGDFQIAAVEPSVPAGAEVDLPAFEAKYTMSFDSVSLAIAGGYQAYDTTAGDVDSYVLAAGGKAKFGNAFVSGNVYFGENGGDLMWINTGISDGSGSATADVDNFGFILVAGFKATDVFEFEVGYGWAESDIDGAGDDEVASYYINSTVTLAPGVFFVPEIGMVDFDETGQEETFYYGAKWQINF